MKKILSITILLHFVNLVNGQFNVIQSGKILYEKRTNQFSLVDNLGLDNAIIDQVKQTSTQILIDKYELCFNNKLSTYKLVAPNSENKYFITPTPSISDFVVQDFAKEQINSSKSILGNSFFISDSLPKYKWKILDEIRVICGFECKKAITKIYDSVYVVAFFATDIAPSTGPESFSGLPGLILELAIPRLYTTWVAQRLILSEEVCFLEAMDNNSQKTNHKKYYSDLQKIMANLPPNFQKLSWMFDL